MSYAESHEDEWILSLFSNGYRGMAVDVGASEGWGHNNTAMLENLGWTVLCIEPNPYMIPNLKDRRENVMVCACDSERDFKAVLKNHAMYLCEYSLCKYSLGKYSLCKYTWINIKRVYKWLVQVSFLPNI